MGVTKVPEGASWRFRAAWPDGAGGAKVITGYSVVGRFWSDRHDGPALEIPGSVEVSDGKSAIVDLSPSQSAAFTGQLLQLEIEASLGAFNHKALQDVEIQPVPRRAAATGLVGIPVDNEIPSGAVDGVNAVFALRDPPVAGSLQLNVNGVLVTQGTDFTLAGVYITFLGGSIPPLNADLLADYRRASSSGTPITLVALRDETPAGTMDSANPTFTLTRAPVSGSLKLWHNGLRRTEGVHFTLSGLTITFLSPYLPDAGDSLHASFR